MQRQGQNGALPRGWSTPYACDDRRVEPAPDQLVRTSRGSVAELSPGYFALVMATGIVSMGLQMRGFATSSRVLFALAGAAYAVLVVLNIARLIRHRERMVADFCDPRRAFGFFTFVAGTNVLGARAGLEGWDSVLAVLLAVALLFWLVLGYVVPWSAVLGHSERPVVATARGSWFNWVVATQSVAVAATGLEPQVDGDLRLALAALAVLSWSVGLFLYAATGMIVALRMMLYDLRPEDIDPPYWISMGALAITVLAGARIVDMQTTPVTAATSQLVAGLSVVLWCFATWLIPVLVAMGWWRHVVRRLPLRYTPTLWSIIFPFGMYAVCSMSLGHTDQLPIIEWVGAHWLWVAVTAWGLVFVAMLVSITRGPRPAESSG